MADWPDGQPDLPWHEPGRPVTEVTVMSGGRDREQNDLGIPRSGSADPAVSALRGCAPNPIHDEAVISFVVGDDERWNRPQHVTLAIYTVAGRCVSRILDAELPSGEHSVVWNRRTSVGARAPAGCYLYALTVAGNVMNGKMVLLR